MKRVRKLLALKNGNKLLPFAVTTFLTAPVAFEIEINFIPHNRRR